jgi:hypothetical protein
LLGDHAEKVKAIEVVLIDSEDLPVIVLGFGQLAGVMMLHRPLQQLGNSDRGSGGWEGRQSRDRVLP